MEGRALVETVVELASVPAPTFAEERRLAWLEERLTGAPGTRERDAAGNLVWRWGSGRPRLLLLAHVDTVFPESTALRFERVGGDVVGPGIGDNAAAVAVVLEVVGRLLRETALAPGAVAFTVCEEGLGNLRGAWAACRALAPEAVVAVEGHGLEQVVVDAVGSVRAEIRVTGPGGHSWRDRGLPSALHEILRLGARLADASTREVPVNVGLVSGGRAVNAIASDAELTVDVRALEEAPLARFEELLGELAAEPPLAVSTAVVGRRPAGRLGRDAPLLDAVRAVRRQLELPDALGDGSTDANAALALGIPALALGVARGSGMHSLAERIDAGSLELGRRQLEHVVRRLLA